MPGAGMRAESVLRRMSLPVDALCIQYVVEAYLAEHSVSLAHVLDADQMVRSYVDRLQHPPHTTIFSTLLQAYAQYAYQDPVVAEPQADALFRFWMIQHRNKVTAEEPTERDLWHWYQASPREGSEKCVEYHRLLCQLYDAQVIATRPSDDVLEAMMRNDTTQ